MTAGDWALFASISLIWGGSFLLIAESLEAFTPGVVTVGRVGLGAITLSIIRVLRRPGVQIETRDWPRIAAVSLVWVAIPFTLYPIAQQWINSAVAGLLNGATPIFVGVVGFAAFRAVPRRVQVAGLAVGFVGVVLISLGSAAEGASQLRGVLLVLLATVCYGIAFNVAPPLQAKYGGMVLMSHVLTISAILVLPLLLADTGDSQWSLGAAIATFVLGAVGTGIAYWIMATLMGRVGAIRSSVITYLIPVVSLVLGVVFRGDSVSALALVGAPLTILGAVVASRSTK